MVFGVEKIRNGSSWWFRFGIRETGDDGDRHREYQGCGVFPQNSRKRRILIYDSIRTYKLLIGIHLHFSHFFGLH